MSTRREFLAAAALTPLLRAVPRSSFKLGVTTDEIDEDLLTALRLLREFGLEYGEVRSIWGKYADVQPIEKIREARALMDEHQVKTSMLSTSFFKVPLPPDGSAALEQQWKLLDDSFDRAAILGTKIIRTFSFTYKSSETPCP